MKMAFVLFDGMTTLDLTGFFEAVTWIGIPMDYPYYVVNAQPPIR
ncbi:hypothetical protein PAECIP111893_01773 [Paenibacillus plantiphilus]|uniref:DJ-1/PfpI family protein n=1 Tax=Paenibacillus plantiphilus TaxID=2905650 RepID=A0ABN8G739_9BACL|nr:hypothetical protein [Paenibacillus plantiphilus]CAH1201928.1 hypothetical protein PAECIP111893_01773 [Paenibacillus plantiphilus]